MKTLGTQAGVCHGIVARARRAPMIRVTVTFNRTHFERHHAACANNEPCGGGVSSKTTRYTGEEASDGPCGGV